MQIINSPLEAFPGAAVSQNMCELTANEYPGRLVGAGVSTNGEDLHVVTAIMGRSATSQTRTYELEGESVKTVPFGEKIDPLTVYRTMTRAGGWHIASNGDQTDTVFDKILNPIAQGRIAGMVMGKATEALLTRDHEPGGPNFTPRISLAVGAGPALSHMPALFSVIDSDPQGPRGRHSRHFFYRGYLGELLAAGTGYALTTYEGNGDPLPSFQGAPRPIALGGSARETAEMYADVLDAEGGFLVSAAAKAVNMRTGRIEAFSILNKYGPNANYPVSK